MNLNVAGYSLLPALPEIVLAIGATRLTATLLFGIAAVDIATFLQVVAVVGTVSVLACAVPSARVTNLQARALSAE